MSHSLPLRRASSGGGSSIVVPLAVGLGVGVPCAAVLALLVWLYFRHRRVSREEDQRHENIDIDGDVTLYESQIPVTDNEKQSARPQIRRDDSSSFIYTPYISDPSAQSVDGFSRSMTSVLGPSPFHQSSSEALRGTTPRSFSNSSLQWQQQMPPRLPSQPWSDQGSSQVSYISSRETSSVPSSIHDLHSLASNDEVSDRDSLSYGAAHRGSIPLDAHLDDPDFRRLSTVSRNKTPPLTNSAHSSRVSLGAHRATFDYEAYESDDPRISIASDASLRTARSNPRAFLSANPQFSESKSSLAHSALAHEIVPGDYSNDTPDGSDEELYSNRNSRNLESAPVASALQPAFEPAEDTLQASDFADDEHATEPLEFSDPESGVLPLKPQPRDSMVLSDAPPVPQPRNSFVLDRLEEQVAPEAPPIPQPRNSIVLDRLEEQIAPEAPPVPQPRNSVVLDEVREPEEAPPVPRSRNSLILTQLEDESRLQNRQSLDFEFNKAPPVPQPRTSFVLDKLSVESQTSLVSKPEEHASDVMSALDTEPSIFSFISGSEAEMPAEQLPTPESTPVPEFLSDSGPAHPAPLMAPPRPPHSDAQAVPPITPDTSVEMDTDSVGGQLYPQRPPSPASSLAASSIYAESSVYPESSISNRYGSSNPGSPRPPSLGSFRSPPQNFAPVFSTYMDLPDVPMSGKFSPKSSRRSRAASVSAHMPKTRPSAPAPRNSMQVQLDESVFLEPKRKFGGKARGKGVAPLRPAHGAF